MTVQAERPTYFSGMSEFFRQRRGWALNGRKKEAGRSVPPAREIPSRLDYEFEWKIINRCNYRCSYCFFETKWLYETSRDRFIPLGQWLDAWMKMYERYGSVKIIITGGEPSLYPEFLDLMATLTRYHRVSFDTNLFRKLSWVRGLTQQVVPDHLYMGISYHAEFSTDLEDFIRKVEAVRDAGIEYRVHLVCYPPLLKRMPAHYEAFRARGLRAMPYPFRGRFQDKTYPQAYSDEEKQIILGMMGENLSQKNLFWIKRQLDPVDPYGKLCYAGQRYGRIENDGTVWRCNQYLQNNEQPLGNIFDADFPLHPEPRPCASHACGCEWWWLLDYYERRHSA